MKLLQKLFIIIIAATAVTGCRKLNIAPTSEFSSLTFWKVNANVYNALYNNYHLIYNDALYFNPEAVSDNAFAASGDLTSIAAGTATANTQKFAGDWGTYYSCIKSCNEFLANIGQNTTLQRILLPV